MTRLKIKIIAMLVIGLAASRAAPAVEYTPEAYIQEGLRFEKRAMYYQAARYYFQALQRANDDGRRANAYAYVSNALAAQGLHQAGSYFFLKAVSMGDDRVVRGPGA